MNMKMGSFIEPIPVGCFPKKAELKKITRRISSFLGKQQISLLPSALACQPHLRCGSAQPLDTNRRWGNNHELFTETLWRFAEVSRRKSADAFNPAASSSPGCVARARRGQDSASFLSTVIEEKKLRRFNYNDRSELAESARYLGTDVNILTNPVPTEYRHFNYDPIGNRTALTIASNSGTYTTNNLNQYSSSTLPANTFTNDFDGNLTQVSGAKNVTYVYDAENRLISSAPTTPAVNDKKLTFSYDYQGRRVQKVIANWTGSSWSTENTKVFVYDGWNPIEEVTTGANPGTRYYIWGADLSQSLQGAGGIGGLLAKVESGTTHAYLFDGNGNVGQLVNASTGSVDAQYEYDPYANSIVSTGSQAAGNPFRFSTKYLDTESGLYYFDNRFYDTETGRWTSSDPIQEPGFNVALSAAPFDYEILRVADNKYAFVINAPSNFVDPFGLRVYAPNQPPTTIPRRRIPTGGPIGKLLPKIPLVTKLVPWISAYQQGQMLGDILGKPIIDYVEDNYMYINYLLRDKCGVVRYVGRTGGGITEGQLLSKLQEDILWTRLNRHKIKIERNDLRYYEIDALAIGGDDAKDAIRGREQQAIDRHGKAISDDENTPLLNRIRGVAKDNEQGRYYHQKSNERFGQLYWYTGN